MRCAGALYADAAVRGTMVLHGVHHAYVPKLNDDHGGAGSAAEEKTLMLCGLQRG